MKEQLSFDFGWSSDYLTQDCVIESDSLTCEVLGSYYEYAKMYVVNGAWEFYYYHDTGMCYLLSREQYDPNGGFFASWKRPIIEVFGVQTIDEINYKVSGNS
jgi:hypothetical protein